MFGYIFETTNIKTGETYLGKRYAVSFDKNYLGEGDDIAKAIEQYGRPSFTVKMIYPGESQAQIDYVFDEMMTSRKPEKKVKVEKAKEEVKEEVVAEKKPAPRKKRTRAIVED